MHHNIVFAIYTIVSVRNYRTVLKDKENMLYINKRVRVPWNSIYLF